jgi:hypothetical protein
MALSVKTGVITSPTSTGSVAYTGIGFQPKLVKFFCVDKDASSGAPLVLMFGAAASSSQRWCGYICSTDAQINSQISISQTTANCIQVRYQDGASTSHQGIADFVSMDADGFTLNWSGVVAAGHPIQYEALGGTDLTNVFVGTFDTGTATGNLAITGVGFTPHAVEFHSSRNVPASTVIASTSANPCNQMMGAMDSAGNQFVNCWSLEDAQDPTDNYDLTSNTRCYLTSSANGAVLGAGSFVSMDADGFTVNRNTGGTSVATHYIAYKTSGGMFVGTDAQKTSTGTQAKTGVGAVPLLLHFYGSNDTSVADTTFVTGTAAAIGITDNSANELALAVSDTDGLTDTETTALAKTTKVLAWATGNTPTVVAEADCSTLDSDGYTLNWTTADATARAFGFVAFKSPASDTTIGGFQRYYSQFIGRVGSVAA